MNMITQNDGWKLMQWLITIVKTSLLVSMFVAAPCFATTWYLYENEDGTVGADLPSSPNGPYLFYAWDGGLPLHDETAKYANANPRVNGGKYAELTMWSSTYGPQTYYNWEIYNPNGTYGAAFNESNPIHLTPGNTYYHAGFFRYERMGGLDVFHALNYSNSDPVSYSKLWEFLGPPRWLVMSGMFVYAPWQSSWYHKFTFDIYHSPSDCPSGCMPYNENNQNVAPYSQSNPYLCDYEKWYAVVLAYTPNRASQEDGRIELFINGTKVSSYTGKMQDTTDPRIIRLQGGGTIAQPKYDAPQHKLQFDGLIFTDELSYLQSHGYFQNPQSGSLISSPINLRILQ